MKMMEKSWHKIASSKNELFSAGSNLAEIILDQKRICLALYSGKIYALSALCPHAGGLMAEGYTDGIGNIVCPVHHYRFQLATGRNISGEGYHLKTYQVEEREDEIYIAW